MTYLDNTGWLKAMEEERSQKKLVDRSTLYLKIGDEVVWDKNHYGRVVSCKIDYPDPDDTICLLEQGTNQFQFKLRKELHRNDSNQ